MMTEFDGTEVEVNEEGFFVDPSRWTEAMAPELAEQWDVPTPLTEQHWLVLHFMRKEYFEKGTDDQSQNKPRTSS